MITKLQCKQDPEDKYPPRPVIDATRGFLRLTTPEEAQGEPLPSPVPATMLVDTGADHTVFSPSLWRDMDILPIGRAPSASKGAIPIELNLGGAEWIKVPTAKLRSSWRWREDVLLGRDFLRQFFFVLDGSEWFSLLVHSRPLVTAIRKGVDEAHACCTEPEVDGSGQPSAGPPVKSGWRGLASRIGRLLRPRSRE